MRDSLINTDIIKYTGNALKSAWHTMSTVMTGVGAAVFLPHLFLIALGDQKKSRKS